MMIIYHIGQVVCRQAVRLQKNRVIVCIVDLFGCWLDTLSNHAVDVIEEGRVCVRNKEPDDVSFPLGSPVICLFLRDMRTFTVIVCR